jgi:hypothetical protein
MTKKEAEDMLKRHRKETFWDFFDFLNEFFLLLPGAIASLAILFFVFILPLLLWLGILK